jgi:hypothetical protein
MKNFKHLLTFLLLFAVYECSFAQKSLIIEERKKINQFFTEDKLFKTTPDSNMLIGFSFKISVNRNAEGLIMPITIVASDTSAYKIFPDYKYLTTINYGVFLKDKEEGVFIIPVIIDMIGTQQDEYYTNKVLLDYYTKTILGRSMSKAIKSIFFIDQPGQKNNTENYIYLEPMMLGLKKRTMY